MPGVFILGHSQQVEPLLFRYFSNFFTFILGRPILITPESQYAEKGIPPTPKLDETVGFECLGHPSWTICSPLHLSLFENFPHFSHSYWGGQFLLPQRAIMEKRDILPTPKLNETVGFECLGHPSWTILSIFS